MMVVFVNQDKNLQESFIKAFQKTNNVHCFNEMFEAYKWIKRTNKSPNIIISEVNLSDPSGMQSLKFLVTKNKLKETRHIVVTNTQPEREELSYILSEGAAAVFSKDTCLTDISAYFKYLDSPGAIKTERKITYPEKK